MSEKEVSILKRVPEDLEISWHALTADQALEKLESPISHGLTSEEVAKRQEIYGANQLKEKPRPTFLQMIFAQLNNFIIILLIVSAVISLALGDVVEAVAIMAIVLLNAILGVVQESRAEEALAALKRMAAPEAQVLRDGKRVTVPAHELVPGDIVFLEAGNFIPADLRLIEAVNMRIDEAALTGESVPVEKNATLHLEKDIPLGDRKNTAFMGTTVTYGRGRGLVTSIGMNTQLGMIADMLQSVDEEQTPLQQRLEDLGKLLGYGALAVCALVFVAGVLRAGEFSWDVVREMFMVAVSLAIAAVPEGLPAVVTISLALGMREMVRRHALIRRLASVETLGSATVICTDKTGTLTQNEMTVTRIWANGDFMEVTGSGYSVHGDFLVNGQTIKVDDYPAHTNTLWLGVLNNDAELEQVTGEDGNNNYRMIGDPTEGSILVAAAKAGAFASKMNQAYPREQEIPFDSSRKRMVTIHAVKEPAHDDISPFHGKEEERRLYTIAVKGAPDVVLGLCNRYAVGESESKPLDDEARQMILAANDNMTKDALRVLGLAYRIVDVMPEEVKSEELEKDLIFAGMVGMIDPARAEVKPALLEARGAGIRTIMITGDYPNTAKAIAENIGLLQPGRQVLTGNELNEMDDATLRERVKVTDVFARVSPEHKMRIVDALRGNGEVVAMTGDGVNDAPAIKRADIGVSMGITGTDVAKETADMVLTDDNYASIVSAIEQGRIIYSNIRKFVYFLLSCNLAEIATIFIATMVSGFSPLAAIQLLWLNLLTDGAPALALAMEKGDPDIMKQNPRPTDENIINKPMWIGIVIQTIAITAVTLTAFYLGLSMSPGDRRLAETMAFVTLSLSELLRAYTARSEYYPLFKIGIFSNKWMNYAFLVSFVLVIMVVYVPFLQGVFDTVPLNPLELAEAIPLLFVPSVVAEITKVFLRRNYSNA
ncbi:cation-translocating P-type ATPase [Ornatilinea apprima]|uniref:cation-translocating P-type ATPase n=1 Tax=Ornatilinea apprima TaxID=1134406 RepID=UPI000AC24E7D|nr:cation-translocating P-type ATPase [Ornatilinea apprima]